MADSHHTPATSHPAPPNTHGSDDDAAHVKAHIRKYLMIGGVLILFTLITVALSYANFGSRHNNFIVAMIVATFKVCLVGAFFMHLKEERITIWRFLFFTGFFVLGLFMLTLFHFMDPIIGTGYNAH